MANDGRWLVERPRVTKRGNPTFRNVVSNERPISNDETTSLTFRRNEPNAKRKRRTFPIDSSDVGSGKSPKKNPKKKTKNQNRSPNWPTQKRFLLHRSESVSIVFRYDQHVVAGVAGAHLWPLIGQRRLARFGPRSDWTTRNVPTFLFSFSRRRRRTERDADADVATRARPIAVGRRRYRRPKRRRSRRRTAS